mmetsp:Transcript_33255/g.51004  ORF Transcript_33255/g.51004 Transcript_33255/m.51004 type:complete len:342 (+) Transcript_33255:437-1462(+)
MLHVQEEAVPGGGAEGVTGDGHVGISGLVDVVADLLHAAEDAVGASDGALHGLVVATHLSSFLSGVDDDESDELDEGDHEGAESQGADVVHVGELESKADLSTAFGVLVRVEVVGRGGNHHDEAGLGLEEVVEPQEAEEQEASDRVNLLPLGIGPLEVLVERNSVVLGDDVTDTEHGDVGKDPEEDHQHSAAEVQHGHGNHSLGSSQEIGGSIDDVDGNLQLAESAEQSEGEHAGHDAGGSSTDQPHELAVFLHSFVAGRSEVDEGEDGEADEANLNESDDGPGDVLGEGAHQVDVEQAVDEAEGHAPEDSAGRHVQILDKSARVDDLLLGSSPVKLVGGG